MVKKPKWLRWRRRPTPKAEDKADKLKEVRRRTDAKLKQERARKEQQGEDQSDS
jgi:hypothetical protein